VQFRVITLILTGLNMGFYSCSVQGYMFVYIRVCVGFAGIPT